LALVENIRVTIVCACRNERAYIEQFLNGLARLDRSNMVLDVIIADGMSTDGTRAILDGFARRNEWCRIIDNPQRIVSAGLNQAILLASGEFIVRMDAHTLYAPDYVGRSVAVLKTTGASNAGGPQRSRASAYWQRAIRAGFHSPFASGGARYRDDRFLGPVDTVPYGCWRRDFLLSIGLFDESLVRNQDDELNMRIRAAGGTIWQDPAIVSWYSPRSALIGLFRQYLQFGFWRVAVLRKHPSRASLRHYIPGVVTTAVLSMLILVIAGFERKAVALTGLALISLYVLLSCAASFRAASREGWDLLPALPVTFVVYQGAYAIGFSIGLLYWFSRRVPKIFRG
jgi:glycosyltransferase involved in cell wall biosynthesis